MKKKIWLIIFFILSIVQAFGQNKTITGELLDSQSNEKVQYAVVQLLRKDSTYATGTTSDDNGKFSLQAPEAGEYIVQASFIGYKNISRNVRIVDNQDVNLGQLVFKTDSHLLKEVTVTGSASKVVLKEDTFQYNVSAYRVPEGSTVEALVKLLPGAEVSSDGTIKINGKEVKKILIDGKEFMTGDTKTALKNLPTSIVDKVKAYDQQSDLARVTGIDDGEETTVLDFGVKKGMNRGILTNIDLSIGSKGRYSERAMGGYFNDKIKSMLFGSANNVNDMGFGGGGPRGGGPFGGRRDGLNATKMVGLNINYDNGSTLQWDGSLRWNHSNGDLNARVSSENFVAQNGSFSNKLMQEYTRTDSWDGRFRLEWSPDSAWNIMFRPRLQLSKSDGINRSSSAAFTSDPYEHVTDPLGTSSIAQLKTLGLVVNNQRNNTITFGDNKTLGTMLQINRKIGRNGRNVTLRFDGNYGDSDSQTFSTQDIEYYLLKNAQGLDSTYQAYRYNLMPVKNIGYAIQGTYSEPVANKTYLQFSYQYKYDFSKSDRNTYDFSNLGTGFFNSVTPEYRSWPSYLTLLPRRLEDYLDKGLSRYSEYRTYAHDMQLTLRMVRDKWNLNTGVMVQPLKSDYTQDYLGVHIDTTRRVVNWSPTLDFRYKFNTQSKLRINYRGIVTQPSMSQLLDITDNTDPQNISVGNPGLKPAFTNRFRLFYNTLRQSHSQSLMTFAHFSTTKNAIGNSVTYETSSGARTVRPVNVNGNWDANAAFMLNTSVDSAGVWNINTFTIADFNRYAGLLQQNMSSAVSKNITKSLNIGERLSGSYRSGWFDIELDGSLNYTNTRNNLQPSGNLNTWQFSYGTTISLSLPWGMSLSTDIHRQSRRGYNDASLNSNELLWNAQLSQSMLRGNALTISLQFYDILRQQSNLSRVINSLSRTDTEYNSINSYAMLKATFNLNIFGGRSTLRKGDDNNDFGPGGDGPGGPPPGGPPPGGNKRFGGPPPGGGFGGR